MLNKLMDLVAGGSGHRGVSFLDAHDFCICNVWMCDVWIFLCWGFMDSGDCLMSGMYDLRI